MERGVTQRVLVIDLCTPQPDKDAGSIAALSTMRTLQQLGCKVTFVPEDNYLYLDRYTADLQRAGIDALLRPLCHLFSAATCSLTGHCSISSSCFATRRRCAPWRDPPPRASAKVILSVEICTTCAPNVKPLSVETPRSNGAPAAVEAPSST